MNTELLPQWRAFLQAVDPTRPVSLADIEHLYAPRPATPVGSVSDVIAGKLLVNLPANGFMDLGDPQKAKKFLLCGSRGSGKTVELSRIGRLLRDTFAPIQVDLAPLLPEGTGSLSVLLVLAAVATQGLAWWRGDDLKVHSAGQRLIETMGRLQAEVPAITVDVGRLLTSVGEVMTLAAQPGLGAAVVVLGKVVGGGGAAVGQARKLWDAHRKVEDSIVGAGKISTRALPPDSLEALLDAINNTLAAIQEQSGRPPLLLVDGLDKGDLEDVLSTLDDPRTIGSLAVPAVFTGPVNLLHDVRMRALEARFQTLPVYNIAVQDHRTLEPSEVNPKAIEFMDLVLRKRLSQASALRVAIERDAIVLLARKSAGCVRHFLQLVEGAGSAALFRGSEVLALQDAEAAVTEMRHKFQFPLTGDDVKILAEVMTNRRISSGRRSGELLFDNYILCYPDGDLWYWPHELLVDWVRGAATP